MVHALSRVMSDWKESTDGPLISVVDKRLAEMAEIMRQEALRRKIEFALQNTNRGNFTFFKTKGMRLEKCDSKDLVQSILWASLAGGACYLPEDACVNRVPKVTEKHRQEFRKKVEVQLRRLLGSEPQIHKKANGRWSVFCK